MAGARRQLVSLTEVARLSGYAEGTVRRLADSGAILCSRNARGDRQFDATQIETLRNRARKTKRHMTAAE